jgi:hypothetical protein
MWVLGWGRDLPLSALGLFTSWLYLRFFQAALGGAQEAARGGVSQAPGEGTVSARLGDHRSAFAFPALWPPLLRQPVRIISNLIGKACLPLPCFHVVASSSPRNPVAAAAAGRGSQLLRGAGRGVGVGVESSEGGGPSRSTSVTAAALASYTAARHPSAAGRGGGGGRGSSLSEMHSPLGVVQGVGVLRAAAGSSPGIAGGTVDPVAERRRARALKALDARLAMMSGGNSTSSPVGAAAAPAFSVDVAPLAVAAAAAAPPSVATAPSVSVENPGEGDATAVAMLGGAV